ncbi:MAG: hypothetical protein JST89_00135 [Cyanobacteria bacterium SZAS-4]|nr:hypothetical protein [Cyanobacteria bacterium SZAS-4]
MKAIRHEELWEFAQKMEYTDEDAYRSGALDAIGLLLHEVPFENHRCENCLQFAGTGGDFITYNYWLEQPFLSQTAPIIMHIPIPDTKIVVGENLYDFLCLGCELGYFYLSNYAFSPNDFLNMYQHPEAAWKKFEEEELESLESDELSLARKRQLLTLLTEKFELHPWNNIGDKMLKLQEIIRV